MKTIELYRHTDEMIKKFMKDLSDKCTVSKTGPKEHTVLCYCDEKSTVDNIDTDGNNHITQKEVIEHFGDKDIVSKIDKNKNGRITKKELNDFIKKGDK